MEENFVDPGVGGGEHIGLRPDLQCCNPSRPDIRVGDVGPDTSYGTEFWGLQPQGGPSTDRETFTITSRRRVVLTTPVGGYEGVRDGDNQDLHCSPQ